MINKRIKTYVRYGEGYDNKSMVVCYVEHHGAMYVIRRQFRN